MNRLMLAALAVCASGVLQAGERVDLRLDADPRGRVVVEIVRGKVTVEGWDEQAVHVQGTRDDKSEEFVFERNGREIVIQDELKSRSGGRDSSGTHITVRVPRGSDVDIDTVSAAQRVRDIDGDVRLEAVSGGIDAAGLRGDAAIGTVSGDIVVAGATGEVRLESVSGGIDADVDATRLDVEAVSGDAIVNNGGALERLDASTISGDLEVRTALAEKARANLESVSGDVTLTLRGELDARFYVETGPGGDIENGLTDQSPRRERYVGAETLDMRLGEGSADVEASVITGTVTLRRE